MDLSEGAKPPSSPTAVVVALLLQNAFEGVEDLGAPAQGVGEGLRANGHDHELLKVDVGVGVAAAVEDVHHGRGGGGRR